VSAWTSDDVVALHGLRGHGRHGWYPQELAEGQDFVVDVELALDTGAAAATDELADTVDYGALARDVVAIVEGEPVRLIETLAQRVADRCLADERVRRVLVTVHKPQAPMPVPFADVTVTIERRRYPQ
jgi:dihydroneopterin aldolase